MTPQITAVLVSAGALIVTLALFQSEERRGTRFFHTIRTHLDFWLLKIRHMFNVRLRAWGRYFIRQIIHYFVHTILTGAVHSLSQIEKGLTAVARSNRAIARKSERERSSMNHLEEVALHKIEMALTDEEKRIRRRKSLEG